MIVRCLSKKMFFTDENGEEIQKKKRQDDIRVLHFKFDSSSSFSFYMKDLELKLIPKNVLQKLEKNAYIIKTNDNNQIIIQFLENDGRFLKLNNDGILCPVSLDSLDFDDSIATYNRQNGDDWKISDIDIIENFNPYDTDKKEKNYFFSYGFMLEKNHGIVINNFLLYN